MLVAFDTETTGLTPGYHEVIEIGAVMLNDNGVPDPTRTFECKLQVEHPDRAEWAMMGKHNHWSEEVWKQEAIPQREGWLAFTQWLFDMGQGGMDRARFVGHNVSKFDYPMMTLWCSRLQVAYNVDYHPLDTIVAFDIWRMLTNDSGKHLNLSAFAKTMGITNPNAHTALADAMTAGLAWALCQQYLKTMIRCGPFYTHEQYLADARYRLGLGMETDIPLSELEHP